jgi:CheY-like chemotaxis protein
MMGGELWVKSALGQGTSFWFEVELPVVTDVTLSPLQPTRDIIGYKGKRRRVLVVDDKAENRTVLKGLLMPLGFEIVEAENGQDSLEKAVAWKPDLILMDLVMPVMDGFEAIRQLRKHPTLSEVIVICVSASVLQQTRHESAEAGSDDFLSKPVRLEDLVEKLQSHLKLEWRYAEGPVPQEAPLHEELIPPPPEDLTTLYELATVGDLMSLRERLHELISSDPGLAPFGDKITQLANALRIDEIEQFVAQYMKNS